MKQKIEVTWRMSKKSRMATLIETGEEPSANRSFYIDLVDLTPEQREPIVELLFPDAYPRIEASAIYEFDPERHDFLKQSSWYYDEQPDIDTVVSVVARQVDEIRKAEAHKTKIEAQKRAEHRRLTEIYEHYRPQIESLSADNDYDALNHFWRDHPDAAAINDFKPRPRAYSLSRIVRDAMREIRKDRWQAQMDAWAMQHGSDHLRDCIKQGYHCERIYALERAAQEWPGWTVDFYNEADWKTRTNPSHRALQVERDLMDEHNVEIVWLVKPAQDTPPAPIDEYYSDPFESCEAIVIHDYLDKYDLVRAVSDF